MSVLFKDVDGLNVNNVGTLTSYGDAPLKACTPSGIMQLLVATGEDLSGKHAVRFYTLLCPPNYRAFFSGIGGGVPLVPPMILARRRQKNFL